MKNIYKIYPTWAFSPTLENFWETSFYTTGKYYDYIWKEENFKNAEVLLIWCPIKLEYWKYIPNKYIWKIKNMWIVNFQYLKKQDKIEILEIEEIIKWKKLEPEEIEKLQKCIYKQCCYQNQEKVWNVKTSNLYIQVYKPILQNQDILYKQKKLYDWVFNFDIDWNLKKEKSKKIFKITENIFYDLEKWVFIKDWIEILFSPYNSEKKKKFLELLIKSSPKKITKEKLWQDLWIDNKKLLDLKRSLLNYEFEKYLWIKKDFVEKNILIAEKNKGYMIIWK